MGSSPRMRGSLKHKTLSTSDIRIIPAHAGLTYIIENNWIFQRDHPRACGAHQSLTRSLMTPVGSSPRMRGSQQHGEHESIRAGIIPAHAGLTYFDCCKWYFGRDHPRACGAHKSGKGLVFTAVGSSPRMRGSLA